MIGVSTSSPHSGQQISFKAAIERIESPATMKKFPIMFCSFGVRHFDSAIAKVAAAAVTV